MARTDGVRNEYHMAEEEEVPEVEAGVCSITQSLGLSHVSDRPCVRVRACVLACLRVRLAPV